MGCMCHMLIENTVPEAILPDMLHCLQKRLRVMTATEPSAKIMLQKGKERARCA